MALELARESDLVEARIPSTRRNIWALAVDAGVKPEDMKAPEYWAHIAASLRQGDFIEAEAEDGAWFATFRVLDAGVNWAKVAPLQKFELDATTPDRKSALLVGHTVVYKGTHALWCVIRDVDKHVLKDKLKTESDAFTWLSNYARTVSQAA